MQPKPVANCKLAFTLDPAKQAAPVACSRNEPLSVPGVMLFDHICGELAWSVFDVDGHRCAGIRLQSSAWRQQGQTGDPFQHHIRTKPGWLERRYVHVSGDCLKFLFRQN